MAFLLLWEINLLCLFNINFFHYNYFTALFLKPFNYFLNYPKFNFNSNPPALHLLLHVYYSYYCYLIKLFFLDSRLHPYANYYFHFLSHLFLRLYYLYNYYMQNINPFSFFSSNNSIDLIIL